jgi:hypothetical protein
MVLGRGGAMATTTPHAPTLVHFPWAIPGGRWDVAYCVPGTNTKHSVTSCATLGAALRECRRLNGEAPHA